MCTPRIVHASGDDHPPAASPFRTSRSMPSPFESATTGTGVENARAIAYAALSTSRLFTVRRTTSAGAPGGSSVAASTRTGRPGSPSTVRPFAAIAATWAGRPIARTDSPASVRAAANRLPTAPAPKTTMRTGSFPASRAAGRSR